MLLLTSVRVASPEEQYVPHRLETFSWQRVANVGTDMRDLARRLVPRSRIAGAALAFFFVTFALAVTLALQQIAERAYFILFVPAVMFSTWFGGHRAGVLASALTVVATIYLLPRTELGDQLVWLVVAGLV
jgi:hypothetical protein